MASSRHLWSCLKPSYTVLLENEEALEKQKEGEKRIEKKRLNELTAQRKRIPGFKTRVIELNSQNLFHNIIGRGNLRFKRARQGTECENAT